MMSLRSRKLVESATNEQDNCHHHKRRWRLAFKAIYFTRLLTKKLLQNNVRLLRSVSYVSIDVQPTNNKGNDLHGPQLSFIKVDKKILNEMIRDKNFEFLTQLGGVKQVASNLQTDTKNGIIDNNDHYDVLRRKNVFGANTYQKPPTKGFLSFVFDALKDTTIIILMVCAVLSLGFGIKQNGWKDGWFDGGSIIVAVFLVLAVSAVSNFNQSRQFEKLSIESGEIRVEVVRNGRRQLLSIFDIVVGDVVNLKIGDQIPADGLFLEGHSLKIDESSMTGESDHVEINNASPFLLSGTKVTDGFGFMLVTSVGMNTAWGEMMSSISRDSDEETPLQERLNKLTSYIGKIGMVVALLVLVVLMVRYFTGYTKNERGMKEFNGSKTKLDDMMNSVLNIISAAVTIVVVAIPEGLPLAVTLTLAYSMKKMMNDNAMVRKLSACETMGSATTICTDKTGTLTLNEMKVTDFWMGKEALTLRESSFSQMEPTILALLQQAVGLNTTGSVYIPVSSLVPEVSGSPTEKAILSWAVSSLGVDIEEVRQEFEIIHVETFNSEKKRSGVLIKRNYSNNAIETHWKGAAEMILSMCSFYCDRFGAIRVINDQDKTQLGTIIQNMAAKSLRCIAFAHKKVEVVDNMQQLEETELTLLGIVCLKDPCRPGVKTAVESCRAEERMEMINKIRVMARSSPFDKLLMVQCLKQKGHVVAVTGDGTNDAPALKEADIGLSMGIQGTEVAKESSDIVILDDNFNSVVTVIRWGRCVYNNIQKFIQFQLTVNVAALVVNFVAATSSGKVPLTAVQLLWVNLIMDTMGALALATEQPTNELMEKPPVGRTEPLITKVMWRNLIAQALYQITVLLTLQFKGRSIFGVHEKVNDTLIFNAFVLCQVFNEFNARSHSSSTSDGGVSKEVCQHCETRLGAVGSLYWHCSFLMANWLACQVHSSSSKLIHESICLDPS